MTKIVIAFDTEDFTNPKAADTIYEEAKILEEAGIRGCFCTVGFLASQLTEWGRTDVIDALKKHEIDLHSLGHSVHPLINEYTDIEDFSAAKDEFLRQENYAMKLLKENLGVDKVFAAVPPGNQDSYVAMLGYAEMGIPNYSDSICAPDGKGIFYCNAFHTSYTVAMEDFMFLRDPFRIKKELEKLAQKDIVVLYTHPHRARYSESWDILNYDKKNLHEYNDWVMSKTWRPSKTTRFYKNLRKTLRLLKKDKRFVFRTFEDLANEYVNVPERVFSVRQVPALYKTLSEGLMPCSSPSLSLCDMFFACAEFLQGKTIHVCERVCGPLEKPIGIDYPVVVTKKEVFESARSIDIHAPIPSRIRVGQYFIGPADWLYAAVEALYGVGKIQLQPTEQLPDLSLIPKVKNCSFKGTWRHSDTFEDKYLSDRLRYQSWTMRFPE